MTKVSSVNKKNSPEKKVKQNCPNFPLQFGHGKTGKSGHADRLRQNEKSRQCGKCVGDIYSHPLIFAWVDFRTVCLCFEAKRSWRD